MKFVSSVLVLLALASQFAEANDEDGAALRGNRKLPTLFSKGKMATKSWSETLGNNLQCKGAVCGLWGDPHIYTCDGLGYDCNIEGVVTLMKNFMFNIQGRFQSVGQREMVKVMGWGNYGSASQTTDIAVEITEVAPRPKGRLFQFSHLQSSRWQKGLDPEMRGCANGFIYTDHGKLTVIPKIEDHVDCRVKCEAQSTCTQFYYASDHNCHLFDDRSQMKMKPKAWGNTVAGRADACGHPQKFEGHEEDAKYALEIGNGSAITKKNAVKHRKYDRQCPIVMYVDGEIHDLSGFTKNEAGYLYGEEGDDVTVRRDAWNKIFLQYKTEKGYDAEVYFEVSGNGPGEVFPCHWNMFVCLPQEERDAFEDYTVGLFGSPDGNRTNDWTEGPGTPENKPKVLPLPKKLNTKKQGARGQEAFDYCKKNWCVDEDENLVMWPTGGSFDDIACQDSDNYEPIDEKQCAVHIDKIREHCNTYEAEVFRAMCEVECCADGCDLVDDEIAHIQEIKPLGDDEDDEDDDFDIILDIPTDGEEEHPPLCEGNWFSNTGDTVCPDAASSIVKVVHQTGDLPDTDQPLVYDLRFLDEEDDDRGKEISFKVNNPFGGDADVYVRYEKSVGQSGAHDPACQSLPGVPADCFDATPSVTVGCTSFPGIAPFALVDVYFASNAVVTGSAEVEQCCYPKDYGAGVGVVKYTFKIKCGCPSVA